MDYSSRSLKAQLKQANRQNARFTLIVGTDELARQQGTLRNMASQEQRPVDLSGSAAEQVPTAPPRAARLTTQPPVHSRPPDALPGHERP